MNSVGLNADNSLGGSRVFPILLALYVPILYPILRADRYYNDDLKRSLLGRQSWDATGRPLTNLLMRALQCYDYAMVDISPFAQLAAVAVLAGIGALIGRRYVTGSPWLAALVSFPIGAQPFFLENLSYKFDALSMSLAMLLALLPIIALKSDRRGWWLGILALFASLNLYQAAINAYLIFVLLDVVLAQLGGESPRRLFAQFLQWILQAGIALLAYQLIVGIHVNGWVKEKSEKIHSLAQLQLVKVNIADFYEFIGGSFNEHWWMYFGPVLLILGLFPVVVGIRYATKARREQPVWISVALFATAFLMPFVALACVPGLMLLLVSPPIAPRELVGIGALLAASLIVMQASLQQWHRSDKWSLSAASMLAIGMCVIASAYGNALGAQKKYEERIAARLADDLAELNAGGSAHAILLDGSAGYSSITAHIAEQFPLIRTLVPTYLSAEDMFHTHIFLMYYLSDFADLRLDTDAEALALKPTLLARTCQMPAARRTRAYSLYMVDATAVVTFNSTQARLCQAQ